MTQKKKKFNAYQLDLHYLNRVGRGPEVDTIKWDASIIENILSDVYRSTNQQRTKRYQDSWLMYIDYLDIAEHYIFGRFSSAEYGTRGELIHADSLISRTNPKEVREGETEFTYFYIRKSDGLMLLQTNLRLTRARFEEYIEDFGSAAIQRNNLTFIQVCTLVMQEFFENVRALNTINKLEFEVITTEAIADENPVVQALNNHAQRISSTAVKVEYGAKYDRTGLTNVIPLLRDYKDKRGVNKIVVRGKLAGAEKIIKLDDSQESYKRKVEVDLNNQAMLESVLNALREIAAQRGVLR